MNFEAPPSSVPPHTQTMDSRSPNLSPQHPHPNPTAPGVPETAEGVCVWREIAPNDQRDYDLYTWQRSTVTRQGVLIDLNHGDTKEYQTGKEKWQELKEKEKEEAEKRKGVSQQINACTALWRCDGVATGPGQGFYQVFWMLLKFVALCRYVESEIYEMKIPAQAHCSGR